MTELLNLSEMESEDTELVPEILPVDTRLAINGDVKSLFSVLQSVVDVAPQKEVIPNTSFINLEAFQATPEHVPYIQASATDGERTISMLSDGFVVRAPGAALIPGRRLLEILRLAPASTVKVDVVDTTMMVRSGRAVWKVSVPPPGSFLPPFASTSEIERFPVPRQSLLNALELSLPAVCKSTSRQSLMQAEIRDQHITACDGVRAHKVLIADIPNTFKTTLPLRFVETAIKELRYLSEEYVEIGTNHSTVAIFLGKSIITSQRLNFEYPSVGHLILGPALANKDSLTVNVADLASIIKRVRVNADPEFSSLYLSLRFSDNSPVLSVWARDKKGNASQEDLEVSYEGELSPKDIVVNHRYLLDFLACIQEPEAVLKLGEITKSKQSPIYVKSEFFEGSLMPMAANVIR